MMIVDTHVHLYPDYDLGLVLRRCSAHLHTLAPEAVPVACLTERRDCNMFRVLCERGVGDSAHVLGVEVLENGRSLVVRFGGGVPPLFVLPGRQIVTRERLELHCLGKDAAIPDGEPAVQVVGRILELDGLAVLPWGVGKWLFRRRKVVDRLLARHTPQELLLGDSAMRPWMWPVPMPMRAGRRAGFRLLAGSDPLPHEKTGRWIGKYATVVDAPFLPAEPGRSCLEGLRKGVIRRVGCRPGPLGFAARMAG